MKQKTLELRDLAVLVWLDEVVVRRKHCLGADTVMFWDFLLMEVFVPRAGRIYPLDHMETRLGRMQVMTVEL